MKVLEVLKFVSENISSANTSSSTSRRNSSNSTLKCDNVTKYPDKKQIEDKLNQIREYLKITNSLMTNMKNTDEQVSRQQFLFISRCFIYFMFLKVLFVYFSSVEDTKQTVVEVSFITSKRSRKNKNTSIFLIILS